MSKAPPENQRAASMRSKPTLRIGELAARSGRSIHTIRWYEAQGLIPGVVRDKGKRRVYNERHISWLEFIERLKITGMSVAQMREYTALIHRGAATLKQQQTVLSAHRMRVENRIAEWTAALKLLDRKIDFYTDWLITGVRPKKTPSK